MEHYHIYHHEVPSFLEAFAQVPAVQRLKQIGMNCGCEYTSFPLFEHLPPYSRYDHSMGVALIVWHFTRSCTQAVSGLLHDIATPVFAHVVDFMNGDYLKQESTEAGTEEIILGTPEFQILLEGLGIDPPDVCDYHRYPVADNDPPRLSADRLEYSLGNMLNYGFCTSDTVRAFYRDLIIGRNETGQEEIMFKTPRSAEAFALLALQCSRVYISDEDRYSMQILSEIMKSALERGILESGDLYTSEPEVPEKLQEDGISAAQWKEYCAMNQMLRSDSGSSTGRWRQIVAKKRFIDPMVVEKGRISRLSAAFSSALNTFLHTQYNDWLCGTTEK